MQAELPHCAATSSRRGSTRIWPGQLITYASGVAIFQVPGPTVSIATPGPCASLSRAIFCPRSRTRCRPKRRKRQRGSPRFSSQTEFYSGFVPTEPGRHADRAACQAVSTLRRQFRRR